MLALVLGASGLWRLAKHGRHDVAGRTWLTMSVVFILITVWLRSAGP